MYFLPIILAAFLRHPSTLWILLLNLLLGWTIVGWIGALIWVFIRPPKPQNSAAETARERYAAGEITADELEDIEKQLRKTAINL